MWYSKKMQNRVRFQIAAIRVSTSDTMKLSRESWEEKHLVPNDVRGHKEKDRWIMPIAIRAVSSRNLESRRIQTRMKTMSFSTRA